MSKTFPLPGSARPVVAAPAPGRGPQLWAGAPSAVLDEDGTIVVGYRVRNGPDTTDRTVVARSADGERLTPVLTLDQDHFGAEWTERPALVRLQDGGWRMYVSCATRTRLTTILPDGRAAYDGRASAEENWFERIGLAVPDGGRYVSTGEAVHDARYLEVLPLPDGSHRIYYEARLPDESHELRTELVT